MSKFQAEYSMTHQSFEDFILVIFVLVDDLYKKVAPNQVKYRPNVDKALLSDFSQLNAQRVLAKTFGGLSLRSLAKFLAFNLCLVFAQTSHIKSLIF